MIRTWHLLILVGALAACGSSGSGNGSDPTAWVGNWNAVGTQSTTCNGATTPTQLTGLTVIAAGSKAGTIQTTADNCTLLWDLSGATITLESGQTCTVSVAGANVTVTWTQSSATLSGTTITGTNTGATNNGCSFMQQYTLTKM
jgi:hypothetical protein